MKNKIIWNYFDDKIEYPKNVSGNPIPYGEYWEYISSTFLNGFINYVRPFGCYVLNRYTKETDDISERNVSFFDKGDFPNWKKFKGTKKELIDSFLYETKETFHTNLSCFGDDILIIAEAGDKYSDEEKNGKYIFFWFDMHVSDCGIGRFETVDSKEDILISVENFLHENYVKNKNHEEIHDKNLVDIINYHYHF